MQNTHYQVDVKAVSTYLAEQSYPEHNRYVFAYTVTINNSGEMPVRLMRRHWLITDANGKMQEVRGDGVVGEQPHLRPGDAFQYTSAAMLATPVGSMHGSYQMLADDGHEFDAPIPPFSLALPHSLH